MEAFSSFNALRDRTAASISETGAPEAFNWRTALPWAWMLDSLSANALRRESSWAAAAAVPIGLVVVVVAVVIRRGMGGWRLVW